MLVLTPPQCSREHACLPRPHVHEPFCSWRNHHKRSQLVPPLLMALALDSREFLPSAPTVTPLLGWAPSHCVTH
jgi:hypothetical protein